MGIFTELSILYSKYRPSKCKHIVISIIVSHLHLISDGTPQTFRLENQHPQGRYHAHYLSMYTQTLSRLSKPLKRLISGPSWFSYTSNMTSLYVFLLQTLSINAYGCSRIMRPWRWLNVQLMLGNTTSSKTLLFGLLMSKCGFSQTWRCSWLEQFSRYYKALTFYLQEQPTLLTDLLTVLIPRIEHARVVRMFRQIDHVPLIRAYLIAVQHVSRFGLVVFFIRELITRVAEHWDREWCVQRPPHRRRRL